MRWDVSQKMGSSVQLLTQTVIERFFKMLPRKAKNFREALVVGTEK